MAGIGKWLRIGRMDSRFRKALIGFQHDLAIDDEPMRFLPSIAHDQEREWKTDAVRGVARRSS
jgi:hypothetical protein